LSVPSVQANSPPTSSGRSRSDDRLDVRAEAVREAIAALGNYFDGRATALERERETS